MFGAGQQFGIYTLIQRLGRGGFGEVWLAERRTKFATTQVAVKLPLDEQVDHAAIEQEAQLWARASGHANVLPIIEANEYDGQVVIVSEYAPDGSLEALLQNSGGVLPVRQSAELTIGILKGLEFLHSRNIIHRDIKPGNILLQGDTPRMADFGISRVLKTTSHATSSAGTPYYMAPEAFKRTRNAQTDVWSVGVMLYQMLKGELPFPGDNITDIYGAIVMSEPEPLADSLPLRLREIVFKALSKDVSSRYQTAREMREELEEFRTRLSQRVATQVQEPVTLKDTDYRPTVKIPDSQAPRYNQPGEIKIPATMPEIRHTGPSTLPEAGTKTRWLYFAIPAVVLLMAIIGGVYLLRKERTSNTTASNNKNIAPVQKTAPDESADKLLIPFRKGGKWGFCDANKKLIVGAKYDDVYLFNEGLARVELNSKAGFIDKSGNEIIPLKYDLAFAFSEGLARVELNKKWGFIDKTGKEIISLKYDGAGSFSEGAIAVKLNDKWGFIDKSGNEIISFKYDEEYNFSEGLATVVLNNKYGFIDKTGKEIIPIKYDDAWPFSEGSTSVKQNNKWGFIDKSGKEIIPFRYDDAWSFSEELARVRVNNKWGFIDKSGREIIPLRYDSASSFSEGAASAERNGKYGFIDKTGKEIIPFNYDAADSFVEGLANVSRNGKWFYIDKNGTEYYEP